MVPEVLTRCSVVSSSLCPPPPHLLTGCSHRLPEMVIFLPFDIVLPRADKGSFIRAKVYAKFEELIATTYAKFEAGELHPGGIAQPRRKLHGSQMLAFVKTTLASVVVGLDVEAVAADEDLFSLGVNSLQAARMRAVFQRDLELGGRKLPTNVVFENPTIERSVNAMARQRCIASRKPHR